MGTVETWIWVNCNDYDHRPEECIAHSFYADVCPIGKSILKGKRLCPVNR